MVRRTGAHFFVLELSWAAAEPAPRRYRVEEITRAARVLRQSGAVLHLDLPLVHEAGRDVPADLANVAFDDPKLSLRLGGLLDALRPAFWISRRFRSATTPTPTSPTSPRSSGHIGASSTARSAS